MLKKLWLPALFALFSGIGLPAADSPNGKIKVTLSGFRNSTGVILVNLFNKPDGYPSPGKAYRQEVLSPADPLTAIFRKIPYGEYSISVIHDENKDSKFTMRWFPWPKPLEGGGFSNNAEARMGPPDYEKTIFVHNAPKTELVIQITYP